MNFNLKTLFSISALATLALLAAPVFADEPGYRSGVVIDFSDEELTIWTEDGRETIDLTPETVLPADREFEDGNLVLVHETSAGNRVAERVTLIDEEIYVEGDNTFEKAIIGSTEPSAMSPDHIIVRTASGGEAFVIDPMEFGMPLPEPGAKVAVTYRVQSVTPPRYKATGLVELPASFDDSPVQVSYAPIPQPVAEIETVAVVDEPAIELEVETEPTYEVEYETDSYTPDPVATYTLPQTGSSAPLAALLGGLLLGLGVLTRFWQ